MSRRRDRLQVQTVDRCKGAVRFGVQIREFYADTSVEPRQFVQIATAVRMPLNVSTPFFVPSVCSAVEQRIKPLDSLSDVRTLPVLLSEALSAARNGKPKSSSVGLRTAREDAPDDDLQTRMLHSLKTSAAAVLNAPGRVLRMLRLCAGPTGCEGMGTTAAGGGRQLPVPSHQPADLRRSWNAR